MRLSRSNKVYEHKAARATAVNGFANTDRRPAAHEGRPKSEGRYEPFA